MAMRMRGLEPPRCRDTSATWAIESGIELWYLARVMGTSIVQIEYTYTR